MPMISKIKNLRFPQVFNMKDNSGMNAEINALGQESVYPKGSILLRLGDVSTRLYYLHSGTIYCYRASCDKMNLSYVQKKGFFGERWYFSQLKSTDEMVVEEESRITIFHNDAIEKILENPTATRKILYTLSLKCIYGNYLADSIRNKNVKERLEEFINQQFEETGAQNSLSLNLSQKELAALLGVHPVSVSRAFSEMKKEMNIKTSKNRIVIHR